MKVLPFIKNNVLEIILIFCTGVLIALYCCSWLSYQDLTIRAVIAFLLVLLEVAVGCGLSALSRKTVSENYIKTFIVSGLAVLVAIYVTVLITQISYYILFLITATIITGIALLIGILIICTIEIIKLHGKSINAMFFPK